MKRKKWLLIIIIIIWAILCISILIINKSRNNNYIKLQESYILDMLKKSEIIEKEFGNVKSLKILDKNNNSYIELGYWANYKNCIITNDKNQEYNIKIIFNEEYTSGIYAYEIDDKIIYEDIEKVQPNFK